MLFYLINRHSRFRFLFLVWLISASFLSDKTQGLKCYECGVGKASNDLSSSSSSSSESSESLESSGATSEPSAPAPDPPPSAPASSSPTASPPPSPPVSAAPGSPPESAPDSSSAPDSPESSIEEEGQSCENGTTIVECPEDGHYCVTDILYLGVDESIPEVIRRQCSNSPPQEKPKKDKKGKEDKGPSSASKPAFNQTEANIMSKKIGDCARKEFKGCFVFNPFAELNDDSLSSMDKLNTGSCYVEIFEEMIAKEGEMRREYEEESYDQAKSKVWSCYCNQDLCNGEDVHETKLVSARMKNSGEKAGIGFVIVVIITSACLVLIDMPQYF